MSIVCAFADRVLMTLQGVRSCHFGLYMLYNTISWLIAQYVLSFQKKLRDIRKSLIEGSNFFCVHTVRDKKCVTSVHCIVAMLDSDPAKEVFFFYFNCISTIECRVTVVTLCMFKVFILLHGILGCPCNTCRCWPFIAEF